MKINPQHPIGIFDSGLGGLTVVKEISRLMPSENFIYIGDTARVPYGTKSPATIQRYAKEISHFLISKKIKLLVVACNSASATALRHLRSLPVPVIGVIDPGAIAAVRETKNKKVGVIGTQATISSGAYDRAIHQKKKGLRIWGKACPLFVPLVEEGRLMGPITKSIIQEYLSPMKKKGIDALVLGCTHYPLLKPAIKSVVGKKVQLIDSAKETALQVQHSLKKQNMANPLKRKGKGIFYTTDDPGLFSRLGSRFLGRKNQRAHHLPLESI